MLEAVIADLTTGDGLQLTPLAILVIDFGRLGRMSKYMRYIRGNSMIYYNYTSIGN